MTNIDIKGNPSGGQYNIITFFGSPTAVSTFNSSLCAIIGLSNSQQTFAIYKPNAPLNPFTSFIPNSGYIVQASSNFTISVTSDPPSTQGLVGVKGNSSGGQYNVIVFDAASALPISTFNSSLCAIIGLSNSQQTFLVYRPGAPLNPFSTFVPGSGYVIQASANFNIPQVLNGFVLEDDENSYLLFEDDSIILLENPN